MAIHGKRRLPLLWSGGPILALALGTAWAAVAFGQRTDLKPLLAKVDPAIVRINDRGFGVVVDAATGLVATNYHVIAGTKEAAVTFPADHDGKTYPVEGLLAKVPGKDLALIRITAGGKTLHALKIAEKPVAKGLAVYAGVPLGFTGVLSGGTVAAVSSGREVDDLLTTLDSPYYYKERLGLDPDAVWIQVVAPISPGRDGGPLVNADGELVGITTFRYEDGPADNLHYAISAIHLKKLMATAGTKVQPLSEPPAAAAPPLTMRPVASNSAKGDLKKTLAVWKELNKALIALNEKLDDCEKRIKAVAPANPASPTAGAMSRSRKKSQAGERMAEAFKEYAGKVKAIDTRGADPQLIPLAAGELEMAAGGADLCHKMAMSIATHPDEADALAAKLPGCKEVLAEIRTKYNVLRVILSHKYGRPFPTLEETAGRPVKTARHDKTKPLNVQPALPLNGQGYRTWTSSSGRFRLRAKLIRVEDGLMTLETAAGKKIKVPVEKLSEEDQRFIENVAGDSRPP